MGLFDILQSRRCEIHYQQQAESSSSEQDYRFLVTEYWLECFEKHRVLANHFYGSDRRVITLGKPVLFGWIGAIKSNTMWLEHKELMHNVTSWWEERITQGKLGYI